MTKPKHKSPKAAAQPKKQLKKPLLIAGGIILALVLVIYISFQVSPRPGALIIRHIFNQGGQKTLKAMEAALPDYPVRVVSNLQYRPHDSGAKLDVYIPAAADKGQKALPVVIWTHGGGWLSGDKTNDGPYFKRLANEG
jgi:acetyl esterase/lipase